MSLGVAIYAVAIISLTLASPRVALVLGGLSIYVLSKTL